MERLCAYCGHPIKDTCLVFKGFDYHALQGIKDGKLIYVSRDQSCWDQSDFGKKSLINQFPPVLQSARI